MIQKVIKGISRAINAEFGDAYRIYAEKAKQGLEKPCFFILCVSQAHDLFRPPRYYDEHEFCVHYMPADEENYRRECHEVADRLNYCLEHINVEGSLRGTKMSHEISDGVLLFFVHYNFFVYRPITDLTYMEELQTKISGKGESNG